MLAFTLLAAAAPLHQEDPHARAAALEHFEARVRPVLVEHCLGCHAGDDPKGGLALDSRASLEASGVSRSDGEDPPLLIEAIRYDDPFIAMPPEGKLPTGAIEALTEWIEQGAVMPDAIEVDASSWWCFEPPVEADLPGAATSGEDPVDSMIDARLRASGIEPSAPASRRSWLRRVTFDLTGLPPTPDELRAFEEDDSDDAFERVVDRLLGSPAYGERQARRWLDLVRYAETKAHEFDYPILNAWEYRDYVIRAFDADVPYDRFVTELYAGDLVNEPRRDPTGSFDESPLGTGAWFLGEEVHSPVEPRGDQCDRIAHQVEVLSKATLALGVSCARCHDHKFDPISAEDFHALAGFALSTAPRQFRYETDEENRRVDEVLQRIERRAEPEVLEALGASMTLEADGLGEAVARAIAVAMSPPRAWPLNAGLRLVMPELDPKETRWVYALIDPNPQTRAALSWLLDDVSNAETPPLPQTIVDYGRLEGARWITNGPAFGPAPREPGRATIDLRDHAPARLKIAARPAATAHPVWADLRVAEASSTARASSLDWVQAGRTLVSPTFRMHPSGRIAHLVRGEGRIITPVASHKLVAGPLHRGAIARFDTKGVWSWIVQDIPSAAGLHVRIEITSTGPGGLEVARTLELDEAQEPPRTLTTVGLIERAEEDELDLAEVEGRARLFERLVREAAELVSTGGVAGRFLSDEDRARLYGLAEVCALHIEPVHRAVESTLRARDEATRAHLESRALVSHLAPVALDLEGRDERVLDRGDWRSPGATAPRRAPSALRVSDEPLARDGEGSGRLALVEALLASDAALLQRVWVNRVWAGLFGRGLAATTDDFGAMGSAPTHPEILDHLALWLPKNGWSTKALQRRLVLTRAYRRSTSPTDSALAEDPRNELLAHTRVRRLQAEEIRDALLAVSGSLDRTRFGPPVPIHLTEFMTGRGRPAQSGPLDGDGRRSIYIEVRRNFPHPFLTVFDQPSPSTCHGVRTESNVPAQALAMLNDPFVEGCAAALAERVADGSDEAAVERLWYLALARAPRPDERDLAFESVRDATDRRAALTDLAHVLLNTKEFLFLE